MSRILKQVLYGLFAVSIALSAPQVKAEMLNLVCSDLGSLDLIWLDTVANEVYVVTSIEFEGRGASVADAMDRFNRGELEKSSATITPTSINWVANIGSPEPVEINRLTGVLHWSTPQDPTPPNSGTKQCEKGTVPFPQTKF